MIADFSRDMRYGVRMLTKNSGFTLVVGLSLALGIGLTTAIFSLAYSILLHALPYPNSERLVTLWLTNTAAPRLTYRASTQTQRTGWTGGPSPRCSKTSR